jgi:hypothetical protein
MSLCRQNNNGWVAKRENKWNVKSIMDEKNVLFNSHFHRGYWQHSHSSSIVVQPGHKQQSKSSLKEQKNFSIFPL